MPDIFVSYSHDDADFAQVLSFELRDRNVEVWMDSGDLRAGDEYRRAIDEGIEACPATAVIVSQKSCVSAYVTYEWANAIGAGKKVIPILIDELDEGWSMHPRLESIQYMDFTMRPKGPWDILAKEILSVKNETPEAKVADLTIEELKELLASTNALASASARSLERPVEEEDYQSAVETVVEAVSGTKGKFSDKRILWVDDRPHNNTYERKMFEELGIEFDLALSTDEALSRLQSSEYHGIISDMGRTEGPKEGYVLLGKIRKGGDQTPFFIYAGSNRPQHKLEALRKGAQGSTNAPNELLQLVMSGIR